MGTAVGPGFSELALEHFPSSQREEGRERSPLFVVFHRALCRMTGHYLRCLTYHQRLMRLAARVAVFVQIGLFH